MDGSEGVGSLKTDKTIRKNGFRSAALSLCVAVFAAGFWMMPQTAYGKTDSSVIEKLNLKFKTTYGEQEEIPDPEITLSGANCSISDIQFRTDYDRWKPGKNVRVEITVCADEGKYFPVSLNRSDCKVSGAEFVSAKALDNETLQIKVDYKPVTVLGDTEKAGWGGKNGQRAMWKSVEYASGYMLNLYGDDKVVKRMTVETNGVDLSEYMEDLDKTYYYEVKAVPVTAAEKKYLKEGNFVTSEDQNIDWDDFEEHRPSSTGAGDGGSVKGDNYVMPDGSKETNVWKKVSGRWYYFDGNGNRTRGWQNIGSYWYYMDQNGAMCTEWLNDRGHWYYLGADGAMRTGWQEVNPSTWYYLRPDGVMATGWLDVQGGRCYLRENGAMAIGWQNVGGAWYYLHGNGMMATGWQNIDGVWYYLHGDGAMATGWLDLGGTWYYLHGSGAMATGWLDDNGVWYYLHESGAKATGWQNIGGAWYYLYESGAMATGWQNIGGTWYYLYGNGVMAADTQIDGWHIAGNGAASR